MSMYVHTYNAHIYIYIYICIHAYIYEYIYIRIEWRDVGGKKEGVQFFFGALDGFQLWTIAGFYTEHQKRIKHLPHSLPSFLLHPSIIYTYMYICVYMYIYIYIYFRLWICRYMCEFIYTHI